MAQRFGTRVIREGTSFRNTTIGVVKPSTANVESWEKAGEFGDKILGIATKRLSEIAQKKGESAARNIEAHNLRTINPETGNPEAWNMAPSSFGTIAQDAFEKTIESRYKFSIEQEIKAHSAKIAFKHQNKDNGSALFAKDMKDYLKQMSKNAKGMWSGYINEIGDIYVASSKLNLQQKEFDRELVKSRVDVIENLESWSKDFISLQQTNATVDDLEKSMKIANDIISNANKSNVFRPEDTRWATKFLRQSVLQAKITKLTSGLPVSPSSVNEINKLQSVLSSNGMGLNSLDDKKIVYKKYYFNADEMVTDTVEQTMFQFASELLSNENYNTEDGEFLSKLLQSIESNMSVSSTYNINAVQRQIVQDRPQLMKELNAKLATQVKSDISLIPNLKNPEDVKNFIVNTFFPNNKKLNDERYKLANDNGIEGSQVTKLLPSQLETGYRESILGALVSKFTQTDYLKGMVLNETEASVLQTDIEQFLFDGGTVGSKLKEVSKKHPELLENLKLLHNDGGGKFKPVIEIGNPRHKEIISQTIRGGIRDTNYAGQLSKEKSQINANAQIEAENKYLNETSAKLKKLLAEDNNDGLTQTTKDIVNKLKEFKKKRKELNNTSIKNGQEPLFTEEYNQKTEEKYESIIVDSALSLITKESVVLKTNDGVDIVKDSELYNKIANNINSATIEKLSESVQKQLKPLVSLLDGAQLNKVVEKFRSHATGLHKLEVKKSKVASMQLATSVVTTDNNSTLNTSAELNNAATNSVYTQHNVSENYFATSASLDQTPSSEQLYNNAKNGNTIPKAFKNQMTALANGTYTGSEAQTLYQHYRKMKYYQKIEVDGTGNRTENLFNGLKLNPLSTNTTETLALIDDIVKFRGVDNLDEVIAEVVATKDVEKATMEVRKTSFFEEFSQNKKPTNYTTAVVKLLDEDEVADLGLNVVKELSQVSKYLVENLGLDHETVKDRLNTLYNEHYVDTEGYVLDLHAGYRTMKSASALNKIFPNSSQKDKFLGNVQKLIDENPDYKGKYILVTPKKPFKEAYEQMMNSPYVGANSGTMMAQQFMNAEKLKESYLKDGMYKPRGRSSDFTDYLPVDGTYKVFLVPTKHKSFVTNTTTVAGSAETTTDQYQQFYLMTYHDDKLIPLHRITDNGKIPFIVKAQPEDVSVNDYMTIEEQQAILNQRTQ